MLDNEWETLAELLKAPADLSRRVLAGPVGRLQALHWITRAATSSLDLDDMLSTVTRVLRETMRVDSCGIFLYDESSGTLTLRAVDGITPDRPGRMTLPLGVGITGQAALTRRLQIAYDAPRHPAYVDYPHVDDRPFASQVSVPLLSRQPGRLLGVLNVLTLEPREFWPEEIDFLETATGEIAIAIENALLYSETDAELRRRIAQLELLQQLWRAIASTLDLGELLGTIAARALELSGARGVAIYRQSRASGELELLHAAPAEWFARQARNLEQSLRSAVQDVLDGGAAVWRDPISEEWAVYVLPMITGRRAVGALCLLYPARRPAPEQTGLLHAFTDTAAIAIENAELYEEARRGLARASTLLRELHHRVRNNLQTVAALLSLQARRAGPEARAVLQDAVSRVRSLTVVHDLLSGRELSEVPLVELARIVVTQAVHSLYGDELAVQWSVEGDDVVVSSRQTTVLALLLNEFVTNAARHGFADRAGGRLSVRVKSEGERAVLEVEDDGRGLPADFDPLRARGLGLQIARTLAEVDLRGELEIGPAPSGGTLVRVRFVPEAHREAQKGSVS